MFFTNREQKLVERFKKTGSWHELHGEKATKIKKICYEKERERLIEELKYLTKTGYEANPRIIRAMRNAIVMLMLEEGL